MERKIIQKHLGKSFAGLLAGGAFFFVLTACSGDDSLLCNDGGTDVPASGELVPVSMEAMVENGSMTRATKVTTLSKGSIGVFRTAPVSDNFPQLYNVQYTNDGSGWKVADAKKTIWLDSKDATLHAYYPYGKVTFDASEPTQTTLTVKDYTADDDLCYAYAPDAVVNDKNPKASFLLKHAYARLKFSITRNSNYPTACKITKLVMEPVNQGNKFYTTCVIDISKPVGEGVQLGGETAAWTPELTSLAMYTAGIAKDKENTEIDKLFPPQPFATGSGGTKLTLTIDEQLYTVTIPLKVFAALKAGYESTVKLEVQGNGIEVLGVNIHQWVDDSIGNEDSFLD